MQHPRCRSAPSYPCPPARPHYCVAPWPPSAPQTRTALPQLQRREQCRQPEGFWGPKPSLKPQPLSPISPEAGVPDGWGVRGMGHGSPSPPPPPSVGEGMPWTPRLQAGRPSAPRGLLLAARWCRPHRWTSGTAHARLHWLGEGPPVAGSSRGHAKHAAHAPVHAGRPEVGRRKGGLWPSLRAAGAEPAVKHLCSQTDGVDEVCGGPRRGIEAQ